MSLEARSGSRKGRRSRVGVSLLLVLAGTLAACSDDEDETSSTDGTSAPTDDGATTDDGGSGDPASEAASIVEASSQLPDDLGLEPLSAAAPADIHLVIAQVNIPSGVALAESTTEAAEALGWDVDVVQFDPTPDGILAGLQEVLDLEPDAAMVMSTNVVAYQEVAEQLAAQDIPVVANGTVETVAAPIIGVLDGAVQAEERWRLVAAYVAADSGGDAHVAVVNIPDIPLLAAGAEAFNEEYERLCPGCGLEEVTVAPTDIGTNLPGIVTSALDREPDIDYVVMGFGDMTIGLAPALATGGHDDVKIVGQGPSAPNLEALASGEEEMWVVYSLAESGWRSVDTLARHFTGDEFDPEGGTSYQILTGENVPNPPSEPAVPDFEAKFAELWQVG